MGAICLIRSPALMPLLITSSADGREEADLLAVDPADDDDGRAGVLLDAVHLRANRIIGPARNLADDDVDAADLRRGGEQLVERAGQIAGRPLRSCCCRCLISSCIESSRVGNSSGRQWNRSANSPTTLASCSRLRHRLRPCHGGDAAHALGDTFLADDLEQARLACAGKMGAAAEFNAPSLPRERGWG